MALRARKVSGAFEKRPPGPKSEMFPLFVYRSPPRLSRLSKAHKVSQQIETECLNSLSAYTSVS